MDPVEFPFVEVSAGPRPVAVAGVFVPAAFDPVVPGVLADLVVLVDLEVLAAPAVLVVLAVPGAFVVLPGLPAVAVVAVHLAEVAVADPAEIWVAPGLVFPVLVTLPVVVRLFWVVDAFSFSPLFPGSSG